MGSRLEIEPFGGGGGGAGTVTYVDLQGPPQFTTTSAPVTDAGVLSFAWVSETSAKVLAAPALASGTPSFRLLVATDIPALDASKITSGQFGAAFIASVNPSSLTGTGTVPLGALSGITTGQLSPTAGITAGQIASVNPSTLTGTGTVPSAALPIASASVLGAIKVGTNLTVALDGTLSANVGTVTSVALAAPTEFLVTGSPITGTGTLTLSWGTQAAHKAFMGPTSGSAAPAFRLLDPTDIPVLDTSKITTGQFGAAFIDSVNPSSLTGTGTVPLAALSGLTTSQLSPTAGITAAQIASVDAGTLSMGTVSLARLAGITTTQLSPTAAITAGQIASVNPSSLTGSGIVPLGALSGITGSQLSPTASITSGQISSVDAGTLSTGTVPLVRLAGITTVQLAASAGITASQIASVDPSALTGAGTVPSAALPIASASIRGAIKVGTGLLVALDGTLSSSTGTVSSVALSESGGLYAVGGTPITTSGTLTLTLQTQSANTVFAGPTTGAATTPGFRALVPGDIPALAVSKITSGTFSSAFLPASVAYTTLSNHFGAQPQYFDSALVASATYGRLSLGASPFDGLSTGYFAGQAGGTELAINTSTPFSGSFVDCQVAGSSKFRIDSAGNLAVVGSIPAANLSGLVPLANLAGITTAHLSPTAGITSGQIASVAVGSLVGVIAPSHLPGTIAYLDVSNSFTGQPQYFSGALVSSANNGRLSLGSGPFDGTSGGFFQGAAQGTQIAINTSGAFSGNFLDFQVAGSSVFRVSSLGTVWLAGTLPATHLTGLVPLSSLSNLTHTQLSATAGITSSQIASVSATAIQGTVAETKGGTGLDTSAVLDGQLLIGRTSDHTWGLATITAGTGISVTNGGHSITIASTTAGGTVTAVDVAVPAELDSAGGPITTSGTITLSWALEAAHTVLAGPAMGMADAPTFRALVDADIPVLDAAKITSGVFDAVRIPDLDASKMTSGTFDPSVLPLATTMSVGAIKVGRSLICAGDGTLFVSSVAADQISSVAPSVIIPGITAAQIASVNPSVLTGTGTVPSAALPSASPSVLGAIKVGTGLSIDGFGVLSSSSGTLTSVGLVLPPEFTVTVSPVTSSGDVTAIWANESANTILAGPTTGAATVPAFRLLVPGDIPALDASKMTTGVFPSARLPATVAYTTVANVFSGGPQTLAMAPAATPNYGTLSVGNGPFDGTTLGFFVGASAGTQVAVNAALGFAGHLLDLQVAGAPGLFVDAAGSVHTAGSMVAAANVLVSGTGSVYGATPDGTAAYGVLNLGPAPFDGTSVGHFVGSSSGTHLAINAASGFAGRFLELQVAGVPTVQVAASGVYTATLGALDTILSLSSTPGTGTSHAAQVVLSNATGGTSKSQMLLGGTTSAHQWAVGTDSAGTNTQNFFVLDSASNGTRFFIDAAGNVVLGGGTPAVPTAQGTLDVRSSTAGTIGAVVHGAVSQTADLQRWQDSSGGVQARVGAPGVSVQYGALSVGTGAFDGVSSGFFGGSAGGTELAINAPSAYTGNLVDLQVAGARQFVVGAEGTVSAVEVTALAPGSGYNYLLHRDGKLSLLANGAGLSGSATLLSVTQSSGASAQDTALITGNGTSNTYALTVRTGTAVQSVLRVVGASSQSGDLQQWQDSGGVIQARVPSPGASVNYGTLSLGTGAFDGVTAGYFVGSSSGTQLAINAPSGYGGNLVDLQVAGLCRYAVRASDGSMAVGGASSLSGSVTGLQIVPSGSKYGGVLTDSVATVVAFDDTGSFALEASTAAGAMGAGTVWPLVIFGGTTNTLLQGAGSAASDPGAQLGIRTSGATKVALRVQGAVAQSADLQEWLDSTGVAQASLSAHGQLSSVAGRTIGLVAPDGPTCAAGTTGVGPHLIANTTYYFWLTAVGYDGYESAVRATVGTFTEGVTPTKIALSWMALDATYAPYVQFINIYKSTTNDSTTGQFLLQVAGTSTAYTDDGNQATTGQVPGAGGAQRGLLSVGPGPFDGTSPGAFSGRLSQGTMLACNQGAQADLAMDFFNCQKGGTTQAYLDANGNLMIAGMLTLAAQAANTVFAGPASGGAVVPGFRALGAADVPVVNPSALTGAGTIPQAANTPEVAAATAIAMATNFR